MPYITPETRVIVDAKISELVGILRTSVKENKLSGAVNYVITRICVETLKPIRGWGYDALSNVIKTFECAKLEVYNRLLKPYEKSAANANGDLDCFENG